MFFKLIMLTPESSTLVFIKFHRQLLSPGYFYLSQFMCDLVFIRIFHPYIDYHQIPLHSSIFISVISLCSQFKWKKDQTTDM